MSLRRVTHAEEILDQPNHDPAELRRSLEHVAQVNQLLGGNRGVLRALGTLLPRGGSILDVGSGSADLPRAIARWARRRALSVRITATDLHPQTLEIARQNCRTYPEITVESADALDLPYQQNAFDIAIMSLTLHHFEGAAQHTALRELARVAGRAVIVTELERCLANYAGARLLAFTWWRRNRITRHDGPLSVLRAYTPFELETLAREAGLTGVQVDRQFFFRLLLTAASARAAASDTA